MRNKFQKILSVLITLLIASTVVVSTASAKTSTTEDEEYRASHMPREIYISNHSRTFSKSYSKPPARVSYTEVRSGVRYSGMLTLTDYADAVERWLALYSGYIRR